MFIWCTDYNDENYTDAVMQELRRFRGLKLFRGERLKERFPVDATILVQSNKPPTDFFRAGVFWIISDRLRRVLESHEVEGELLPLRLVDKQRSQINGAWWCFNPTLVLDCFDWCNSRYVLEQNFATQINVLRIKDDVIGNKSLVVTERTIPVLVVVGESLAKSIVNAGCTGVVFRKSEDWRNPEHPA